VPHLYVTLCVEAHCLFSPKCEPCNIAGSAGGVIHVAGAEGGGVCRPLGAVNRPLIVDANTVVRLQRIRDSTKFTYSLKGMQSHVGQCGDDKG
jgi:hypothetical protein